MISCDSAERVTRCPFACRRVANPLGWGCTLAWDLLGTGETQESSFIFLQTVARHKPEKLEATAMVVYAFDVDDTLEVSNGPVKLADLVKLREAGHIVGLCGNWAMVTQHRPGWQQPPSVYCRR